MSVEEGIKRLQRLIKIQSMLFESPEGFTTKELSEEFGLTQRAIQRDLAELKASPLNIPLNRHGLKWTIREGYLPSLSPLLLSLPEAITVSLAMVAAWRFSNARNPYVMSSLVKLNELLPSPVKQQIDRVLASYDERYLDLTFLRALESLLAAWSTQRKVKIWYRSDLDGEVCDYLLSPYFIEPYSPGNLVHVIGLIHPFDEVRSLRLEHILRTELTQETYEVVIDFDAAEWLESNGGETTVDVKHLMAGRRHEPTLHVFEQGIGS